MSAAPDSAGEGVLRVLTILEALTQFAASGARNSELAKAAETSPSNVTRAMHILISKGWARRGEDGRFWPTPRFTRMVFAVHDDFNRLERRLQDERRSYTGQ